MMRLTVDELTNTNQVVYVRNEKKGVISLTMYDQNGRQNRVLLPRTRHPLALNDHATPWAIANSTELRKCLGRGALKLLDPKMAEAELAKDGVQAELALAFERIGITSKEVMQHKTAKATDADVGAAAVLALGDLPKMADVDPRADIEDAPPEDLGDEEDDGHVTAPRVNPRVSSLLALLDQKEGIKANEVRVELSNMVEDLTNEDLDYITMNAGGIVRDWAQSILAARLGQSIEK